MEGTAERVRELFARGGNYTTKERAEIEAYSVSVLGKGVRKCNCRDRWRDALAEIWSNLKRNNIQTFDIMATEIKKTENGGAYALKAGVVILWNGKYYTKANITDKVAEAYLAKYPKASVKFSSIPAPKKAETPKETPKAEEPKEAPKTN